jgi:polyisoprenoid-binding protein YceI
MVFVENFKKSLSVGITTGVLTIKHSRNITKFAPAILSSVAALMLGTLPVYATATATDSWSIDPAQSSVNFSLHFMGMAKCNGTFSNVTGKAQYNPNSLANTIIKAQIPIVTINTKIAKRDEHLKTKDFFDEPDFPVATFTSNKVTTENKNSFKIDGTLSIHGASQNVTLVATRVSESLNDMVAKATTELDRKTFKIGSGPKAAMVGDKVAVTLNVHLIKDGVKKSAAAQ